jgi:hypothetical protein
MIQIGKNLIENFSGDELAKQNNLFATGLIFILSGSLLYLIDSTIIGKLFLLPGINNFFRENVNDGSLDLSFTRKQEDVSILKKTASLINQNINKAGDTISNTPLLSWDNVLKHFAQLLSISIVSIGSFFVIGQYAKTNLKALLAIYSCPALYTIGFIFFIASYQNYDSSNKNNLKWLFCLLIGMCFIFGSMTIHILTKDKPSNYSDKESNTDKKDDEDNEDVNNNNN